MSFLFTISSCVAVGVLVRGSGDFWAACSVAGVRAASRSRRCVVPRNFRRWQQFEKKSIPRVEYCWKRSAHPDDEGEAMIIIIFFRMRNSFSRDEATSRVRQRRRTCVVSLRGRVAACAPRSWLAQVRHSEYPRHSHVDAFCCSRLL